MKRLIGVAALAALAACSKPASPAPEQSAATMEGLPKGHPQVKPGQMAPPLDESVDKSQLPAGHPPVDGQAAANGGEMPKGHPPINPNDNADLLKQVEALKAQLKDKPRTLEVTAALGSLYYENGRFLEAIDYYGQAIEQGQAAIDLADKLKTKVKAKKLPGLEAAGCSKEQVKDFNGLTKKAAEQERAGRLTEALACARAGEEVVLVAMRHRANSYFLVGNAEKAVAEHQAVLARAPENEESLFYQGAILFDTQGDDVRKLKEAKQSWEHYLKVADAKNPRYEVVKGALKELDAAIKAGGVSKLPKSAMAEAGGAAPAQGGQAPAGEIPALNPDLVEAVQNTPRGKELDEGLAKALAEGEQFLAEGKFDDALSRYRSVMPYQPQNARVQAGMAWALKGLGKPTAERVFTVAVNTDPSAVEALGDMLKAKGDAKGAKALWQKLAAAAPTYKGSLQSKLAQ